MTTKIVIPSKRLLVILSIFIFQLSCARHTVQITSCPTGATLSKRLGKAAVDLGKTPYNLEVKPGMEGSHSLGENETYMLSFEDQEREIFLINSRLEPLSIGQIILSSCVCWLPLLFSYVPDDVNVIFTNPKLNEPNPIVPTVSSCPPCENIPCNCLPCPEPNQTPIQGDILDLIPIEKVKKANQAVEVWDTTLKHREVEYRDAVTLALHYFNKTNAKIVGVELRLTITNPFGKKLFQKVIQDDVVLLPGERKRAASFYYWTNNQFISDEIYDRLWQVADIGTAKIETKILKVIFESGKVVK